MRKSYQLLRTTHRGTPRKIGTQKRLPVNTYGQMGVEVRRWQMLTWISEGLHYSMPSSEALSVILLTEFDIFRDFSQKHFK